MKKMLVGLMFGLATSLVYGASIRITNLNVTVTANINVQATLLRYRDRVDPSHDNGATAKAWVIYELTAGMTNQLKAMYFSQLRWEQQMARLEYEELQQAEALAASTNTVTE
ncbi:MAG: hypothetical protein V1929_00315 [bacterium]